MATDDHKDQHKSPASTQAPAKSKSGQSSDKPRANQMWGGRFASGPAAIMEEINASIGFDKKLSAQDIRGSKVACRPCWPPRASSRKDERQENRRRAGRGAGRDRQRPVQVVARARRRAHERREPAQGSDRRAGRAAAYGALAQRPGGDRLQPLRARRHRRARRAAAWPAAGAGRQGAWRMPAPSCRASRICNRRSR